MNVEPSSAPSGVSVSSLPPTRPQLFTRARAHVHTHRSLQLPDFLAGIQVQLK